jgi:hypothetical protein
MDSVMTAWNPAPSADITACTPLRVPVARDFKKLSQTETPSLRNQPSAGPEMKPPNLKPEDVLMRCVVREDGDRWIWGDAGMMISGEKWKDLVQNTVIVPVLSTATPA